MKNILIFLMLPILLFSSCGEQSTEQVDGTNVEDNQNTQPEVAANEMDELMMAIDLDLENRPVIKSLRYSKEDMTSVDVTGYLDNNNVLTKLEENLIDGPTGKIKRRWFYSNGGALFATRVFEDVRPTEKGKEPYFSEIVTFYDLKGKAISSKERTAQFEELLEQESYHSIETKPADMTNAMQVLNQSGPYKTTFQGFVHSGPYSFLIVGGTESDNFTAALSIQEQSATINWLTQQGEKALGRNLKVSFDRFVDPQGYEMTILLDLALTEQP